MDGGGSSHVEGSAGRTLNALKPLMIFTFDTFRLRFNRIGRAGAYNQPRT